MLEESYFVAGVLELVDVGPYFGLPRLLMGRGLAATGTAGVKSDTRFRDIRLRSRRLFLQVCVLRL